MQFLINLLLSPIYAISYCIGYVQGALGIGDKDVE